MIDASAIGYLKWQESSQPLKRKWVGEREALPRVTFKVEEEEASVDHRSIPERAVERACEAGLTFVIMLEEANDNRSIEDTAKGSEHK